MQLHRSFLLNSCVALALTSVPAAYAQGSNKELLDVLLSNGTITQQQYDKMMGKVTAEAKENDQWKVKVETEAKEWDKEKQQYDKVIEKVEAESKKREEEQKKQPVVTLDQRGFRVRAPDDSYAIKIGGRLHTQASTNLYKGELRQGLTPPGTIVDPVDGTEIRRARIELSGTIQKHWRWAAEVEYSDNRLRMIDWWLAYTGIIQDTDITVGNQKQPYSLSVEMSSNDIAYVERSIDNALVIPFVDRAIGARVDSNGNHWFFAGGLFGEGIAPTDLSLGTGNPQIPDGPEGWGVVGRFIYAPVITDNSIVHLGVRGAYRQPETRRDGAAGDDESQVRIRDETTNMSNLSIVDTGNISNVESVTLYGPEIALNYGPFTFLGELNFANFDRDAGAQSLDFSSWHVSAQYLFGAAPYAKSYRIDDGEFKRPVPIKDFSWDKCDGGAWELALRYATIDLNDGSFRGGKEDALSFDVNWYINNNIRIMTDWTHILDTEVAGCARCTQGADGLNVLQSRVQWTY